MDMLDNTSYNQFYGFALKCHKGPADFDFKIKYSGKLRTESIKTKALISYHLESNNNVYKTALNGLRNSE